QDFPGIGVQQKIYAHACKRCRTETKWLAIIDADEFILPLEHENIPEFLKDYEDFSQICIHWLRYGSSGHKEKPSGLVVENFTQHEECGNQHVKSIVNPRAVVKTRIHWHEVSGKSVNENKDRVTGPKDVRAPISKIRINHYLVKSFEECEIKRLRGRNNGMLRNITYFQWYDKNDVADGRMAPHAERLKKLITWRNKGGA
ncbi:MAG: glycosyltransferase family 92 protein, partial [Alphaproteobacteria bacterium]|nr:glycosyltransferase family 92 protein [Alphaproteobacteria bacterium]